MAHSNMQNLSAAATTFISNTEKLPILHEIPLNKNLLGNFR
jgi:hypothetical protein